MGILCCCTSGQSNPALDTGPAPVVLAPVSIPDPDIAPTSPGHFFEGEISFLVSDVTVNNWFSMVTMTFTRRRSAALGKNAPEDIELPALPDETPESKLRVFTFEQLKTAAFDFRSDMLLGKGGFGSVYKGLLKEKLFKGYTRKRRIAVKKLDSDSKQGLRQWQTEVGFLARVSHPNIVKLLGYCQENANKELLIVYQFMEKGSLNYHLFGKRSDRLLPWETRLKIITGMARALSYLHTMERPIIFRDFKTSNILLDETYTPKLSDFGLAKWGPNDGSSHVTGNVMGTYGYVGPEYKNGGKLYVKSDVYSYGVVLMEMLTGLRAIDKNRPPGQQDLREWALPFLSDRSRLRHIMDPRLQGKYGTKQASEIAVLAVRCVKANPTFRPSMKEVAETLDRLKLQK
ncbi:probable serine/threonine-protein kinase PIX13 isoform X2 [Populus trichocarpa]|uniref:probable serine/threonine-protein kinase PIX13 isoform X2 n=2 Tax=Populus trichocarpa TaxID=3694 RepID=UPI0022779802|nr:probable serine/threonine-protein kinase PIX13 isoform X2 [Populus trichocarpa]